MHWWHVTWLLPYFKHHWDCHSTLLVIQQSILSKICIWPLFHVKCPIWLWLSWTCVRDCLELADAIRGGCQTKRHATTEGRSPFKLKCRADCHEPLSLSAHCCYFRCPCPWWSLWCILQWVSIVVRLHENVKNDSSCNHHWHLILEVTKQITVLCSGLMRVWHCIWWSV